MAFFSRLLCKLKKWASFKMNSANIKIDDCKTISKTTTQIFQLRDMFKYQIILKKNTRHLFFTVFKRSPCLFKMGFKSRFYGISETPVYLFAYFSYLHFSYFSYIFQTWGKGVVDQRKPRYHTYCKLLCLHQVIKETFPLNKNVNSFRKDLIFTTIVKEGTYKNYIKSKTCFGNQL